jgi:hypothetical protein
LSNFGKAIYHFERESRARSGENKFFAGNRAGNTVIWQRGDHPARDI